MTKGRLRMGAVSAAVCLAAGAAVAQPPGGDGVTLEQMRERAVERAERRFEALDANGDGVVTRDEVQARAADRRGPGPLARADTDGDGQLSLGELQAVRPELTVEQFNRLDRNGDGLIGADERPRRPMARHRGQGQGI